MDRQTVYPGQILPETTLLQIAKDSMVGLAKLSAAVFGTGTMANGFAVTPTGPASLQVVVAPGELYSLTAVDGTAWSSLAADTTHTIVKQGIALDSTTLACAAPTTNGQSISYLIQASYLDLDSTPVLLPYYNSANPSQPYSGLGNNGLTQNTVRRGTVVLQAKAGASAATGSQVIPSPDAGYVGLFVVTVAFGQTAINAANISRYSGAPLLPSSLIASLQGGDTIYAIDTGAANAYAAAYAPAVTTLKDGMTLKFKAANANTGASTFNPNGIGASPLIGSAHSALQGGEIAVNGDVWVQWNSSIGSGSWVLIDSTGGALQVSPATKSQHAVQLAQIAAIAGGVRNGAMSVAAASATATYTADEVALKSALGGTPWLLSSFSKTINLATTGAGGMDTGTAPVSGYVALYVIFNPTAGTSALLAVNATSAKVPEVYGGTNMPSGYTASALVSVWPTNASGLLKIGKQKDRAVCAPTVVAFTSTANQSSFTSVSIASVIPMNARTVSGYLQASSTSTSNAYFNVASDVAGSGLQGINGYLVSTSSLLGGFNGVLLDSQTLYYQNNVTAGTPTYQLAVDAYTF